MFRVMSLLHEGFRVFLFVLLLKAKRMNRVAFDKTRFVTNFSFFTKSRISEKIKHTKKRTINKRRLDQFRTRAIEVARST